jgi:G3E family GTPase
MDRGSDSLPAFALREIARVLSDFSQTPGQTIVRIQNVLEDPHLHDALGLSQTRRTMFGPNPRTRWWERR